MHAVDEMDAVGSAYLAHLTDPDLDVLVRADEVAAGRDRRVAALRSQPALVIDVLDRPGTAARLLNIAGGADTDAEHFTFVSPFLVFAAAIHQTAADLAARPYRSERASPRMRVPLFDSPDLVAYLARPWRRYLLAELLASYARIHSGVAWTRGQHGWRRRRWNDLDPMRLAVLLEAAPEAQRPGIWRRLGDSALFLTGVFPDYAARSGLGGDASRLLRLTGVPGELPDRDDGLAMLEWFGARWYRLAGDRALIATDVSRLLRDQSEHFGNARAVLNTTADHYLFPVATEWLARPGG